MAGEEHAPLGAKRRTSGRRKKTSADAMDQDDRVSLGDLAEDIDATESSLDDDGLTATEAARLLDVTYDRRTA